MSDSGDHRDNPTEEPAPEVPGAVGNGEVVSSKKWLLAAGVAVAVAAAYFAFTPSAETRRARELCDVIPGGNLITANVLLGDALDEYPTIFDTMSEECPEVVDVLVERINQLSDIAGGSGSSTGPTSDELIRAQSFQTEACTRDGHSGTVRNGASVTVDLTIETQFTRDGVLVDSGVTFVSGLRTNQTAEWQTHYFGDGSITHCESEITRARAG